MASSSEPSRPDRGDSPSSPDAARVRLSGESVARGASHRRLITRLASRDIRSHRLRSLLIVCLVGLPVVLVTAIGVLLPSLQTTDDATVQDAFGDAAIVVEPLDQWDGSCHQDTLEQTYCSSGSSASPTQAQTATRDRTLKNLSMPGRTLYPLRQATVDSPWNGGHLSVEVDGMDLKAMRPWPVAVPKSPMPGRDEVWTTARTAKRYGWTKGQHLTLGDHTYTVTAVVKESHSYGGPVVWVGPDSPLVAGRPPSYYGTGPNFTTQEAKRLNAVGIGVRNRSDYANSLDTSDSRLLFSLIMSLGLLAAIVTATIAGAAFAIGARQQRRMLALLGTTGAARRDLMGVLVRQGMLLGVTGALLGALVGLGVGNGAVAIIRSQSTDYPIPYGINWVCTVGGVVIAILAALVACWIPARGVARQDVLMGVKHSEEAARPPRRAWWALVVAVLAVLVAVGTLLVNKHFGREQDPRFVVGVVATVVLLFVAILLFLPRLLWWLSGRRSSHVSVRFALRDVRRNRPRAVAGTAAILAVTTLLSTTFCFVFSLDTADRRTYRPQYPPRTAALVPVNDSGGTLPKQVIDKEVQIVRDVMGSQVEARAAREPSSCFREPDSCWTALRIQATYKNDPHGTLTVTTPVMIDDGSLYELFTGKVPDTSVRRTLREGVISFAPGTVFNGHARIDVDPGGGADVSTVGVPAVAAPREVQGESMPALMSAEKAAELMKVPVSSLKTEDAGVWLDMGRAPTRAEADRIDDEVTSVSSDMSNFLHELGPSTTGAQIVSWGTLGGIIVELCVGGIVLALAMSDSRSSRVAIVSVGASTRTMRRMAAVQAILMMMVGQVLALVVSLVPVLSMEATTSSMPAVAPVRWLLLLVLVPPLLVAVVARFVVSVPPPTMRHLV